MSAIGRLIRTAIIIISLQRSSRSSEFRFCFHGPHKFLLEECPGGVLFKKPLPTTCTTFIKSNSIGDGRLTINGDMCDSSISEEADVSETSATHTFSIPKLQEIMYDGDPSSPTNGADPTTIGECVAGCFKEWIEPDFIVAPGIGEKDETQEVEPGYHYPQLTEAAKAEQDGISEQLFLKLLLNEDLNEGGAELRVAKLLRASFVVLNGYCPAPYVSMALLNKTLESFLFFAGKGNETIKDIGVREYRLLMNVLAQCRVYDRHSVFQIIGKNCSENPQISGALFESPGKPSVIVPNNPKKPRKLDPFIEASWQAISFVNAQCFQFFKDEFNLHHIYEIAMEALFTELVLTRWANPPTLKDPTFWNNLLGSSNFEAEIGNINACVRYAYYRNPYKRRLERPFKMTNGTDEGAGEGEDSGWKGSEQEYWDTYKARGGFPAIAPKLGATCFQSDSDRMDALTAIQGDCSAAEDHTNNTTTE